MKTMLIKCVQENPRSDYVRKPDKPTARPVGQHKDVRVHYRPNGAIRLFDESHISDVCIQRVSANVIQRVFNPDRPETWIRPNFRERLKEDLWDRQVELCSLTQEYFNPVSGKMEISLQTICPVCGEPMSFQGCSIDHIRNWRAYAKEIWKVRDEEQLKIAYNDMDNLILVHSSCNSSKGDSEIEDFGALGHIPGRRATWGASPQRQEMAQRVKAGIDKLLAYYDSDGESKRDAQKLRQLYQKYCLTGDSGELDAMLWRIDRLDTDFEEDDL